MNQSLDHKGNLILIQIIDTSASKKVVKSSQISSQPSKDSSIEAP